MRREERVTVQGPIKEQQPDGMSHRGVNPPPSTPKGPSWDKTNLLLGKILLGHVWHTNFRPPPPHYFSGGWRWLPAPLRSAGPLCPCCMAMARHALDGRPLPPCSSSKAKCLEMLHTTEGYHRGCEPLHRPLAAGHNHQKPFASPASPSSTSGQSAWANPTSGGWPRPSDARVTPPWHAETCGAVLSLGLVPYDGKSRASLNNSAPVGDGRLGGGGGGAARMHSKGRGLRSGPRGGYAGGWRRLPKRLGAVTVGYKCHWCRHLASGRQWLGIGWAAWRVGWGTPPPPSNASLGRRPSPPPHHPNPLRDWGKFFF